ncbi:MAG: DVUA0089 family protein [Aquabacterium sp.]|jgi:hypothetical protein|uniref:DVUA0089 family protein n=1 Tax=Aquabacterium sp. TaxID=1872578 RepID=UPI002A36DBE2|nr:DVUA0089 family protein [Aquabacterium sp.]MDX9844468.1 DVUA0089 family protein [Aquabacterium sp.]
MLTRIILILTCLLAMTTANAIVLNGRVYQIDGDGDSLVDDVKISRIKFDVTAGTTVFFDSLVFEPDWSGSPELTDKADLNGDGYITRFDNQMLLFSGGVALMNVDDSMDTFGDGSMTSHDAAFYYIFANSGTYVVTLGQLIHDASSALQGYQADTPFYNLDHVNWGSVPSFGAWRLTMTATNGAVSNVIALDDPQGEISEPSILALVGLAFVGLGIARRRL